jgi:hypothetical protein
MAELIASWLRVVSFDASMAPSSCGRTGYRRALLPLIYTFNGRKHEFIPIKA